MRGHGLWVSEGQGEGRNWEGGNERTSFLCSPRHRGGPISTKRKLALRSPCCVFIPYRHGIECIITNRRLHMVLLPLSRGFRRIDRCAGCRVVARCVTLIEMCDASFLCAVPLTRTREQFTQVSAWLLATTMFGCYNTSARGTASRASLGRPARWAILNLERGARRPAAQIGLQVSTRRSGGPERLAAVASHFYIVV